MATYTVTTGNWNSPAFWSGISAVNGDTLDLSALGPGYTVSVDRSTSIITISDGVTSFTIGDAGNGSTDAALGGGQTHNFDVLITPDGDDYFDLGGDAQSITAGAGNDEIHSGGGNDTVDGGAGDDYINGGTGNDSLRGGDGSDYFLVGEGVDTIIGGNDSGTDILSFAEIGNPVTLTFSGSGAGTYSTSSGSGTFSEIEGIIGTDGADSINASATSDGTYVFGGDGNDTLTGGTGDDTLLGGDGTDSITGNAGADSLDGGAGADTISGGSGADTIDGGTGNDSIDAGSENNEVIGGSGRDTITTGSGDDTIYGDDADLGDFAGNLTAFDFSTISTSGDTSTGTVGMYAVYDNIGTTDQGVVIQARITVIDADDPNISVDFNANSIYINGDDGAPAGTGVKLQFEFYDQATGEPVQITGYFTFQDVDTSAESVSARSADVTGVTVSTNPATQLTVSDTGETITATSSADSSDATEQDHWAMFSYDSQQSLVFEVTSRSVGTNYGFSTNTFTNPTTTFATTPESQDDSIVAGDGADLIHGGAGNDTIFYGEGADTVFGGDGNDVIDDVSGTYTNTASTIDAGAGNDTVYGTGAGDSIFGGDGSDLLYGEIGDDSLDGGADNDFIYGAEGNDTLMSGNNEGDDYLDGGHDEDVFYIEDNAGSDTIVGGETVTTGRDKDTLDLSLMTGSATVDFTGQEAGTVTDGSDTITFSEIEAINATEQNDTVDLTLDGSFDATDMEIDLGGGDDLFESWGQDTNGNANTDTVYGGAGNDTISTGGSNDQIHGGDGNDLISSGFATNGAGDTVWGGAGDDTINSTEGSTGTNSTVGDHVDGGTGNDSITGTDDTAAVNQGDTLIGGLGNDTIEGLGGNDLIYGDLTSSGESYYVDDTGQLFLLDHAGGGTQTLLHSGLQVYGDIALGPDGFLYGVTQDNDPASTTSGIYRIDVTTGTETLVGDIENAAESYSSIVFDAQGRLYITDDATGELRMYTFDDSNGYVQTGVVGTLQPNTEDIIFLNSGTAWAVANGRLYSYDVAADGTFSNAQDLGEINPGQTDIVGLQLLETGVVVALEASGEGHSTADISGGTPTWTSTGYTVTHSGAVTGAAAYQDQGFGYAGNDLIYGGEGNDTIFVGEGNDSAYGGEGDDYIDDRDEANTSGDNLMDGGAGNDTIFGGDGNSTIYGGTGNDLLIGEGGADLFINADAFGNDTVVGGETAGTSTDDDTLSFEDMTLSGIDITLSGGEAGTATSGADTITFSEIEAFRLSDQNDTLDGSSSTDVVRGEGLAGDDLMLGGSNADSLDGGAGNDTLQGGAGNDTLVGGTGDDTLTGDTGNDSIDGGLDNDSIAGGDGDDTLLGNDGDDTISGGLGADSIDGGSGADVITAGSGDTVASGDGDDVINVSAADLDGGNLTVVGGEGGETLGDTLNITGPATINMTGAESGTVTWLDGSVLTFSEIETINYVPCFTPGVLIKTKRGEVDAAEIAVGDEVLTRDNGYQPVRWIGSRGLTHRQISREESLRPVMIRAGSIAPGWPERDLLVSPQHRVVLSGAQVQLVFGAEEALAAAVHLTRRDGIEQISPKGGVTYIHFMFDRHELVMSNGVWTESFQPGAMSLVGLDSPQRNELFRLFPELLHSHGRSGFPAARPMLKAHQAQVLAAF